MTDLGDWAVFDDYHNGTTALWIGIRRDVLRITAISHPPTATLVPSVRLGAIVVRRVSALHA